MKTSIAFWKFWMYKVLPLFLFCCLLLGGMQAIAQIEGDSIGIQDDEPVEKMLVQSDNEVIEVVTDTTDRPKMAALYSAALPGLGQVYNGKYWKLPIVVGTAATLAYMMDYNTRVYQEYRNSLLALRDQDDRTQPVNPDPRLTENYYERATQGLRRNRDLTIIASFLFYVIIIVDAHVDAHLQQFTVNDDISLNLGGSVEELPFSTRAVGLSFTLTF
jgi:hypothetical protein